MEADVAERIEWVEADLGTWTPRRDAYDLVVSRYVHVAGTVEELVRRLAARVARGGTLLLVGHRPIDPATGAATAAAGQVQVSVDAALAASVRTGGSRSSRLSGRRPGPGRRRDPGATPLLTSSIAQRWH